MRLFQRVIAVLALLLGLIPQVHVTPPLIAPAVQVQAPDLQPAPVVLVYCIAYRAHGPQAVLLAVCATSSRSAWVIQYVYCDGDPLSASRSLRRPQPLHLDPAAVNDEVAPLPGVYRVGHFTLAAKPLRERPCLLHLPLWSCEIAPSPAAVPVQARGDAVDRLSLGIHGAKLRNDPVEAGCRGHGHRLDGGSGVVGGMSRPVAIGVSAAVVGELGRTNAFSYAAHSANASGNWQAAMIVPAMATTALSPSERRQGLRRLVRLHNERMH